MNDLKELIALIEKHKVKRVEVIGSPSNYSSKLEKLYSGIHDGEISNDDEAQKELYKDSNSNSAYSKLKQRLFSRLLNTLFFIDLNQPGFNEIQKAYYSCYKELAATKILIGRGVRSVAIPLLEKVLRKADKFEFTDIALDAARALRGHYGTIVGNYKKYVDYKTKVRKYKEVLEAELLAEEYLGDLTIDFVGSRVKKPELRVLAMEYTSELRRYTDKYNSYRLNLIAFLVYTVSYQISNDYVSAIKVCKEAIKRLELNPNAASKVAITNFLIRIISCSIQLKNYEEGESAAKKALELTPEGVRNWFVILIYYYILSVHTNNFQKAYEIFYEANKHQKYKLLTQNLSEDWIIVEAYTYYLISIKKIAPSLFGTRPNLKEFRVGKFLNEVPNYSKDKRGMNINVLIIQTLFLLQKKDFGAIIDRMEALEAYCYRHLRQDDTFRSNCFLKMLLLLPKASFHKERVVHRAKRYLEKLKGTPLEVSNQVSEIEIIPYETLWEFVVESLDDKIHHY